MLPLKESKQPLVVVQRKSKCCILRSTHVVYRIMIILAIIIIISPSNNHYSLRDVEYDGDGDGEEGRSNSCFNLVSNTMRSLPSRQASNPRTFC